MHPAYPKTHFIAADGPHDLPEQFAIITAYATTAYATTGDVWTDQQNEAADQALEAELRSTGRWMQRTGKQPTAYSRLDVEKKILRTVTDDEWYAYSLAAGKVRYDQLSAAIDGTLPIERTVKMPGPQPDRKIKAPMKKGMADIDPEDKEAMKQAGAILEDIGAAAHLAGLEAIGEEPTPKAKKKKIPPPVIF
jgi:hypothetical protein